ncbi:peptidyl-prolyl cis-trans isomerase [Alloalcanivorax sp. C16-2]|uniref:peptidylprolyl isomerase n=1 Tax=Alloalcanivorax sp. C16-2 TaxID=3390052 RepID=UPI00397076BA
MRHARRRGQFLAALSMTALSMTALLMATLASATPRDARVVAEVDGVALTRPVLDVFLASARMHDPAVEPLQVLENLVDIHLMGEWYRQNHAAGAEPARVGYNRATRVDRDTAALIRVAYRDELAAALTASGWASPLDALQGELNLDRKALRPILSADSGLRQTLNPAQRRAARAWVVAEYRFPAAGPRQLTLADLYDAQNIALKTRFHNLDTLAMANAADDWVRRAFVLDWFERRSPLEEEERAWVRQLVLDRLDQRALIRTLGLSDDPHDDNTRLREVADGISDKEIRRYYQLHRDHFRRVEKVRAARLYLPTQALADEARARLDGGASLPELAEAYADQEGVVYRKPAWLERGDGEDAWLVGFAFTLQQGAVSPPARVPGQARWVILRVDRRQEGFQAADSEAVRYQASRVLARERLQERLRTGLARRHASAGVRFHAEAL